MAELIVEFTVWGYCQPWQRTLKGFITAPETRQYEKMVGQEAKLAMKGKPPYNGFCGLEIEIIHEIPKSWSSKKKHAAVTGQIFPTICDVDNQIKGLSDAMNKIVYTDDRFVNSLIVRREYGPKDKVIIKVMGMPK